MVQEKSYVYENEDFTLGNPLVFEVLKIPNVTFCGRTVNEDGLTVKICANDPDACMILALSKIQSKCEEVLLKINEED